MTELVPFGNGEFELQFVRCDGDSFEVVASGVARHLGYRTASDMLRAIPDSEKGYALVRTPGGDQRVSTLTEPGLYRVIGQRHATRVPDLDARDLVERFQHWLFHETLPALRRGEIEIVEREPVPTQRAELSRLELIEIARAAELERLALAAKVAELEPAAHSWETLSEATGDYSVREAAQLLDRDPEITTGQNQLFAYLFDIGWIDRTGRPYQTQIEAGRLSTRVQTYEHPHSGETVLAKPQVRVTVKGLHELHKRLGGARPLRLTDLTVVPGRAQVEQSQGGVA